MKFLKKYKEQREIQKMKKVMSLLRSAVESLGNRLNPVEVWCNVNQKAQSEHKGLWDLIEKPQERAS